MTNTVLLDHMCAIVKNAKEMRKTVEEPMETDQRPKQVKKGRHAVKVEMSTSVYQPNKYH